MPHYHIRPNRPGNGEPWPPGWTHLGDIWADDKCLACLWVTDKGNLRIQPEGGDFCVIPEEPLTLKEIAMPGHTIKAYHYPNDARPCLMIVDDSVVGGEVLEVIYYDDIEGDPISLGNQLAEEYSLK